MLSLSQLVSRTQKERSRFDTTYRVENLELEKDEDYIGPFIRATSVVSGGSKPRVATIQFYSPSISLSSSVKVHCTCMYFQTMLSLSLSNSDSAIVPTSKKGMSADTLSKQKSGLCPHLLYVSSASILRSTERRSAKMGKLDAKTESLSDTVSSKLKGLT